MYNVIYASICWVSPNSSISKTLKQLVKSDGVLFFLFMAQKNKNRKNIAELIVYIDVDKMNWRSNGGIFEYVVW